MHQKLLWSKIIRMTPSRGRFCMYRIAVFIGIPLAFVVSAFISCVDSQTNNIYSPVMIPDWTNVPYEPFNLRAPEGITNPVLTASDVTDRAAAFVADPFIYHEEGTWYMFFEVETGCADIGLATSSDGLNWTYDRIVLDENFHLSYPVVFKWKGTYYMIPECVPDYVNLYKTDAMDFPYKWTFVNHLLSGRDYADPSIFRYNEKWWMFVGSADGRMCWLYYSENLVDSSSWIEHPSSPIITDRSKARPGGRPIVFDADRIIRFTQKCDRVYGEMVRVFEVETLTETSYIEHELPESPLVKKSGVGWNSNGMHTFDPWWTGDRWICAVDGYDGNSWSIGIYVTEFFGKSAPGKSPSLCYNGYPKLLLHWLMAWPM